MEKILKVDEMTCGHCSARVEKALNTIDGVDSVKVEEVNQVCFIKTQHDIGYYWSDMFNQTMQQSILNSSITIRKWQSFNQTIKLQATELFLPEEAFMLQQKAILRTHTSR